MSKTYYVYILASGRNGTLYIGVTNDLARRVWEHREGVASGFTKSTASIASSTTRSSTTFTRPFIVKRG